MERHVQFSKDIHERTDMIWWYKHLRIYDNNDKHRYFWFYDDIKMSYKWILSMFHTCLAQLKTYKSIYCKDDLEGNRES